MQLVSSGNESALLSTQQGSELCELHDGCIAEGVQRTCAALWWRS